jgi:hypothetical protein
VEQIDADYDDDGDEISAAPPLLHLADEASGVSYDVGLDCDTGFIC